MASASSAKASTMAATSITYLLQLDEDAVKVRRGVSICDNNIHAAVDVYVCAVRCVGFRGR